MKEKSTKRTRERKKRRVRMNKWSMTNAEKLAELLIVVPHVIFDLKDVASVFAYNLKNKIVKITKIFISIHYHL